jgi:hypothetical protein
MRSKFLLTGIGLSLMGLGACTRTYTLPRNAFDDNGSVFFHSFGNATLEVAGRYRVEQCHLAYAEVSPISTKKEDGKTTRVVLTSGDAPFRIQEVYEGDVRREPKEEDYPWVEGLLTSILPPITMIFFLSCLRDGRIEGGPELRMKPVLVR